ncbi:glucose 1-dehydrogenase [Planctomycetota bacterium]|nr:glucose 1-dehydrogenase [Planctomycetota bacterium]
MSDYQPLENKTAIVTGSSRGIGAEVAKMLAAAGANIIVNYVGNQTAAEQVVLDIQTLGRKAHAVKADVAQSAQAKKLFDVAINEFGSIDILVNNAGAILYTTIQNTTDEDFDHILSVNVKGTFNTLREATTRLADGGRIINFSSSVVNKMMPTYGPYAATKGAVEQLTCVLAKEIGHRHITVNTVSPGPTRTELFLYGKTDQMIESLTSRIALGRLGEPEDIAKVVLFLVSDQAAWITGQTILANGGYY